MGVVATIVVVVAAIAWGLQSLLRHKRRGL